jgi:hypothetical protein
MALTKVTKEMADVFDSPTFTGTPAAPTASLGTNTTQLATTEFVKNATDPLIPFVAGDVITSYVQKPGFLECIGQYVYPDSGYAISNILPLNSVSTQTVSNPAPVTNGNFNSTAWLSTTKLLTQRRSSATIPYVLRFHVYDFNTTTKQFGTNTDVTAAWGFPTTNTGEVFDYIGCIDNSLVFVMTQSGAATGVNLTAYVKVVNLDSSGNYVSTDTINTGFTIGGASGSQTYLTPCVFYKHGGDLFILVSLRNSSNVQTYKLYKKISGVWTVVPFSISPPAGTTGGIELDIYNGHAIFRRYVSATAKYESWLAQMTDGQTVGTFYIATNEGRYTISKNPEYSAFSGLVVAKSSSTSDYVNRLLSITISSGAVSTVTALTFPEFTESFGAFPVPGALEMQPVLDANKAAYGVTSQDILMFVAYNTNKKVSAFKITVNSSGVLTKQIIQNETHTIAYGLQIHMGSVRGIIDRDSSFSSSASRLLIILSKVQLPTLTALATNLKYYLKV